MPQNTLLKEKENFFKRNLYIIIAFLASAALMTLVYFIFEMVPFGDITILRMDLYHQYGPLFAELLERLKDGDSLLYSFNSGMGGSFLGNFLNYLSSPLSWLVILFDHVDVSDFIALIILLKCALSSSAMAYYLKKAHGRNDLTIAAFGILYSFCGYFIAYYWNVMWIDAMYLLPFVVLGIENIINKGKPFCLIATLTLTFFSNYYMSFMICIFSVLYFIAYYFINYSHTDTIRKKAAKEEKISFGEKIKNFFASRFINSGVVFAFSCILSAALAACALIPMFFILKSCSATSGNFPEEFKTYFNVFDFLANHIASVDPTIRSSGDVVLPNVYCGIVTLILVPLFAFTKTISKKEKIISLVLLAVIFASFNTNYLNYIWHGLHFPNDLPYRFSFIYSFLLLTIAYKTLMRIREIDKNVIMGVGIGLIVFIIATQKIESKNVLEYSIYASLIATVVYIGVLFLFRDKKYQTTAVSLLLFCCIFSEAACSNTQHFSMTQPKESYTHDYNDFVNAKELLDNHNGNDEYRMELTDLRTRMDPSWYDYYGLSTFSSVAYEKLSALQKNLGLSGNDINSYTYCPQTPVYNAMMSLKYLANRTDASAGAYKPDPDFFTFIASEGSYDLYENKYCLPIAYGTPDDILDWTYDQSNPMFVQEEYFEAVTGISDVFDDIQITNISFDNLVEFDWENAFGGFNYQKIAEDESASLTIEVDVQKDESIYFYLNSWNTPSITVTTDSFKYTRSYDEAYLIDLGYCKNGETLYIEIPMPDDEIKGYIDFGLYTINKENFKEGYDEIVENSLKISSFEETNIKGNISMEYDGILYTSIPYDTGWTVLVDGKEVEKESVRAIGDALLGIDLAKGEHTVEFRYFPTGMKVGIIVSLAALIVLIIFILLYFSKPMKKYRKAFADTKADFADFSLDLAPDISITPKVEVTYKQPEELNDGFNYQYSENDENLFLAEDENEDSSNDTDSEKNIPIETIEISTVDTEENTESGSVENDN